MITTITSKGIPFETIMQMADDGKTIKDLKKLEEELGK